jgi:hypothetical protein
MRSAFLRLTAELQETELDSGMDKIKQLAAAIDACPQTGVSDGELTVYMAANALALRLAVWRAGSCAKLFEMIEAAQKEE